ncbi:hypothetical protein TNCT_438791, partial [Trichonephila clavata]
HQSGEEEVTDPNGRDEKPEENCHHTVVPRALRAIQGRNEIYEKEKIHFFEETSQRDSHSNRYMRDGFLELFLRPHIAKSSKPNKPKYFPAFKESVLNSTINKATSSYFIYA